MTLSIVARCERTGQLGVAAATAAPAVGKLLTHAAAHVGAIATQARINPYLGIDGLAFLHQRLPSSDVLALLKRLDPRIEARQLAIIDNAGRAVAFTGNECLPWAGSLSEQDFSVQGNRLAGPQVVQAAADAFRRTSARPLPERFIEALAAGDAAGGDTDGEESATVYVMDTEEYPLWDIRVDLHDDPVRELRRLYEEFRERLLPELQRMPSRRNPAGEPDEKNT